jgi:hydrophobic/amphiphilic exporter-1 (mainly G- bacteria), HAE1 family
MRFAHFFIERPRFAAVLSILFVVVGLLAYVSLPVAQYPQIAPPTVTVRASYPGATPQAIAQTVATPIEEQINGVENMLYMTSQATNDGAMQTSTSRRSKSRTASESLSRGCPRRSAAPAFWWKRARPTS